MAAVPLPAGGAPLQRISYGSGGGSGVLNLLGKILTTGQKTVGRVVEPLALEIGQGADQLLALAPGALGSNARTNVAARQDRGITGFSLGEILNYGTDSTGARVKLFDDPAFKDNSPIINGALRFGLDVAEDPLNLIGVGTATQAGRQGTKLGARELAKDVMAKTAGKGLLMEEGGSRAASILSTVQRERGLPAALREISKIPEAKAALELAGYSTERSLLLGLGKNGLMLPGTAKLAQGVDRMNEAVRTSRGVTRILGKLDAADWTLGARGKDIRAAAAVAEDAVARGGQEAADGLGQFRSFMEADALRSVSQGSKGPIRDAMIIGRQEALGYTDDQIEKDISRFRPDFVQRLRNGTGMTLKSLKGADGNFVASAVKGRASGVYDGSGWVVDPNSPLHNLLNSVLDEIGTQVQAIGLTHHVRVTEAGKVVQVPWDRMIDGIHDAALAQAKKAQDSWFVAGSITADDLVWRLADTAAADIATAKASGMLPSLVKDDITKLRFTGVKKATDATDGVSKLKFSSVKGGGLVDKTEIIDSLKIQSKALADEIDGRQAQFDFWKENPAAQRMAEFMDDPVGFTQRNPAEAVAVQKFSAENPELVGYIRDIVKDPAGFEAMTKAKAAELRALGRKAGDAAKEDGQLSFMWPETVRSTTNANQGSLFPDLATTPEMWTTEGRTAVDAAQGQLFDPDPHAQLRIMDPRQWAHATNAVSIEAKKFFEATEQIASVWKTMAVARPGFSNRNYWGGLAANLAYGVGVGMHKEMAGEARAYLDDPETYLRNATPRQQAIAREINALGYDAAAGGLQVSGRGVNLTEVGNSRTYYDVNKFRKVGSKAQQAIELGVHVPGTKNLNFNPTAWPRAAVGGRNSIRVPVELNLRLAAVVKFLDDGMSPEAARSLMEHIHFDYADLSKLDRSAKTIYPFWTWRSRNLPNQIENVVKGQGLSRGVVDAVVKAKQEHEGDPFPPFLQGIQVPFGGGLVGSSSALPLADLISRVQDVNTARQGKWGDALRPALVNEALPQVKAAYEILAKRNAFSGAARTGGTAETLDILLSSFVPGADLLPSPFPGVNRRPSWDKNSTINKEGLRKQLENFLRQFGLPGDVRDFSDTVN